MKVVLLSFATKELLAMKESICRASDSSFKSSLSNESSVIVAELSSAKPEMVAKSVHKSMSLINMMKSIGERTLPCGEPTLISRISDTSPFVQTNC